MKKITYLMLNMKTGIYIMFMAVLFLGTSCNKDKNDAPAEPLAEWTIVGETTNEAFNSTFENNVFFAIGTQQKRKLSLKFGVKPTTSAQLKLVDYFKVPLAADEMIIGISEGDFYYLSSGTDNVIISPVITTDLNTNVSIVSMLRFNNVRMGRFDINFNPLDNTTASGYIYQK